MSAHDIFEALAYHRASPPPEIASKLAPKDEHSHRFLTSGFRAFENLFTLGAPAKLHIESKEARVLVETTDDPSMCGVWVYIPAKRQDLKQVAQKTKVGCHLMLTWGR